MAVPKSKPAARAGTSRAAPAGGASVAAWNRARPAAHRATCDALRKLIDAALPKTTAKVWHGAPVWFDGENPVVGYSVKKAGVSLMFWNGQTFGDSALRPVGKFGAAEAVFAGADEIDAPAVRRWCKQAGTNVFDSKAFFAGRRARAARRA